MNTSYFLYLKKEKTDQVFSLKMRKQKLIAETKMINIKLKKIKCFTWLFFKWAIINIITFGYINKNKERNFVIKKLTKDLITLKISIKLINKKILKLENRLLVLKSNYLQKQKLKINAIDLQKQVFKSDYQANLPKFS